MRSPDARIAKNITSILSAHSRNGERHQVDYHFTHLTELHCLVCALTIFPSISILPRPFSEAYFKKPREITTAKPMEQQIYRNALHVATL